MEVKILFPFHDKDNYSKVFEVGTIVEFDDERAERIIGLGYGESIAQESSNEETPEQVEGKDAVEEQNQENVETEQTAEQEQNGEDAEENTEANTEVENAAESTEETATEEVKQDTPRKGRKPRA